MNTWYRKQPGAWLMSLERFQMTTLLAKIKGKYLMQMGGPPDLLLDADSPMHFRFYVSAETPEKGTACIQADFCELPIEPDSLDVVLLIHVLEFSEYPVQALEEAYQSLTPGGRLIIVGFNPWSLWGLTKIVKQEKTLPWQGKFWSRAQVRQWLRSYDCKIETYKTFCFRSPRTKVQSRKSSTFFETLGQLCCPGMGGVYLITAKKKVYAPLEQRSYRWKKHMLIRRRLVQPTTRI